MKTISVPNEKMQNVCVRLLLNPGRAGREGREFTAKEKNYNLHEDTIHSKGESAVPIKRRIDTLGT